MSRPRPIPSALAAIAAGLLLLAGCAHAAGQESRPAVTAPAGPAPTTQPAARVLLPWVEASDDPRRLDDLVDGLAAWRGVADAAIVSVDPGQLALLRRIQDRSAGVRIIPGLKTSPILRRSGLDNPNGWARLAEAIRAACAATGSRAILLEHESSIEDYLEGRASVDFERLRTGLRQLPADVELIWYPSVSGTEGRLERATRLCREVQAVCRNVRFVDHATLGAETARLQSGLPRLQAALKSAATAPPIEMVYCMNERYWRDERVPEAIRIATSDTVIIYPGAQRWKEASRNIAAAIAADRRKASP